MNHAEKLNRLIEIASRRMDFEVLGYRSFEQEDKHNLSQILKGSNFFFTSSILGMEAISHVIEDQAINLGGKFGFYTGCQKISWLKPNEERYKKLFQVGNPVTIFGILDTEPWNYSNLKMISLVRPNSIVDPNLAYNWFVVLNNPQFVSIALVARELPSKPSVARLQKTIYRDFEGFWTYNQTIISEVVNILEDYASNEERD